MPHRCATVIAFQHRGPMAIAPHIGARQSSLAALWPDDHGLPHWCATLIAFRIEAQWPSHTSSGRDRHRLRHL
jgi:hypothetical protein